MIRKTKIDFIGQVFGQLSVLKKSSKVGAKNTMWLCLCDCGKSKEVSTSHLKTGHTISCGCYVRRIIKENSFKETHGLRKSLSYKKWAAMLRCCDNKSQEPFPYYGGRNIIYCKKWEKFEGFYEDMGEPTEGQILNRIDKNVDFTPENCNWVNSKKENMSSKGI